MKKISVDRYVAGVESIYEEKPTYQLGHDGSDGSCDCIGMCRGGLERGGATGVTNMRGTNQAARKTIQNLCQIESAGELLVGDVVLKVRDKDDPGMPLPDRYRKGGSDYSSTWGETNFTHIGTVTSTNPLEITHMTSPTAKKDTKFGNWKFVGELPWVEYESAPEPPPEPDPEIEYAVVVAEHGTTVKMREKPSTSCSMYWDVPVGDEVIVDEHGDEWCKITWSDRMGYMMTKFLLFDKPEEIVTVILPGLTETQANDILSQFPDGYISRG